MKALLISSFVLFVLVNGISAAGLSVVSSLDSDSRLTADRDEPADTIEKWLLDGRNYWTRYRDIPSLISYYAERQLGITYVDGLLDEPEEEQLVVTLDGTDCVIYVETSLALAMTTLQGHSSFEAFRDNIRVIRYREGEIDGYESRLHYFSDWLATNEEKGFISILFQDEELPEIGPVNFMSENRESYKHLGDNVDMIRKIRKMEDRSVDRDLKYIPEDRIPEFVSRFRTGDVLAFVTTVDGLDIIHTALVKMDGGRAGFYHASLTGSVIVDPKTIYEYARNRDNINGIVIARLH